MQHNIRAPFRRIYPMLCVGFVAIAVMGCVGPGGDDGAHADGPPAELPMHVVRGEGDAVLIFVEIHINEQGPYTFAIDTGASRTVIAPDLVEELGLETSGESQDVTSATGEVEAQIVEIETWRIGNVALPEGDAIALAMPEAGDGAGASTLLGSEQFQAMQGLLGSDILSAFGEVTFDFEQGTLILRSTTAESAP